MRAPARAIVLLVVVLLPTTIFAQSQATTGVIEGTVVDANGGALPGVTVALRNTATNYEQTTVTDSGGRFRAVLLPLGPYQATATLEGFARSVAKGLDLGLGQTLTVPLKLTQSSSESIVVTAAAPLIETARTEGATRLDNKAVEGLPNNGRNFLELTKLTPGVTIVQGPDGDELSINGQKGISNNVSVDGADFNNPFFGEQRGGQRPAFTFNLDAVKEMVVVADGANAEFGRSQSGFVNVITKSGTNEVQGTAHLVGKPNSLSANPKNPDGTTAPKFNSNQYQTGFTVGGPFIKDKLFYFGALDIQKASSKKQTDATRIEQRVVNALAALGSANENGPIRRTNDARVLLLKADYAMSSRNNATIRYNYTWSEQENGTFDVDSWGRSANSIEKDSSHAGTGQLVTTISNTNLNEFRFQYARENRPRDYNGPNITGQNRPLPDTAFDFARGYRFGEPFFIPVKYYDTRVQFNDNLSLLKGAHSYKAGVEYNRVNSVQTFVGFGNGRYIFGSTDGFLNYVANPKYIECTNAAGVTTTNTTGVCPAGTSVSGPVLLFLQQAGVGGLTVEQAGTQSIPQTEPAVFVQDSWQATPTLNVQYGLRWEAQMEPDPITPASQVFYAPFIGKSQFGQTFPSNGEIPSDNSMWQPRLGIAWDARGNGRTVLRANAGIFYGRVPGLTLASSRSTNGSRGQTLFRNSATGGVPAYPNLIPASQITDPFVPDVFVFDKNFKNPRTKSLGVSWEQEWIKDYAFLVKYNYAKGDHITRFLNGNDPLLRNPILPGCSFQCGPWSTGIGAGGANGIGTLTVVQSSARSNYQGITVGITKRPSSNIAFQAYYTYSKDKSDDDNERDPFSFRYAKVTNLDAEYGYSDRDQRHRLNSWLLWNAPNEINVNFRYSYRSAQPKSLSCVVSATFCGKDAFGGSRFMADAATPADRINPDGSVTRRNLGRKDNQYSSLDVRVSRQFAFGGGYVLEPALDVFNLLNSKNLRRPEVTSLIFNFDGTVQSGIGDPRQMQLGLRLIW